LQSSRSETFCSEGGVLSRRESAAGTGRDSQRGYSSRPSDKRKDELLAMVRNSSRQASASSRQLSARSGDEIKAQLSQRDKQAIILSNRSKVKSSLDSGGSQKASVVAIKILKENLSVERERRREVEEELRRLKGGGGTPPLSAGISGLFAQGDRRKPTSSKSGKSNTPVPGTAEYKQYREFIEKGGRTELARMKTATPTV